MSVVYIVYALPDEQFIVALMLEPGMTAGRAVQVSGLVEAHPEIGEREIVLGIFGERVPPQHMLAAGDRVEICRPLHTDPRDLRRMRHARGLAMGAAKSVAAK